MQKTDRREELEHLYGPSPREVIEVEVPDTTLRYAAERLDAPLRCARG